MARRMICLDTNYLIRGLVNESAEEAALLAWARDGVPLIAPAVVWYEFVCGPVTPSQIATMRAFLSEIVSFQERQAEEAARLFNAVGRKRSLRIDATIAASAIVAGAVLATDNQTDFELFVPWGLKLL
jgi:predicted nucleic acid-binding protein